MGGGGAVGGSVPFSAVQELSRTLGYTLPSLALLWYLILEKNSLFIFSGEMRPKKEDAASFFIGFPGLVLIGVAISLIIAQVSPSSAPPKVESPGDMLGWIALAFSCLGTGYLEESFFRFYLLRKLDEWVSFRLPKVIFSTLLFALCHAYEGPWGILNAALAGLFLSILFERYKSLHGIAAAHACYNAFVYAAGNFL